MTHAPISRTLHWTPEARRLLENWLAPRVAAATDDGAAADEVAEGLRAHVHEELLNRPGETVDEARLSAVLAAIDGSSQPSVPLPPRVPASHRAAGQSGFRWPKVFLFFGVILPAVTWAVEWMLGLCGNEFFDPLPTLWHVALVALVPASLWFVHRTVQRQEAGQANRATVLAGAALVVAVFYSLAFGKLLYVAAVSTVLCLVMPWLLPLPWMTLAAPAAAAASLFGLRRLRQLGAGPRQWWTGVALGCLLLVLGEVPRWMALDAMHTAATSVDDQARASAITRLRRLPGARAMLHDACFGEGPNRGGSIDVTSWMAREFDSLLRTNFSPSVTMEQSRALYYRVTGRAFTEVKPRSTRRVDVFDLRLGVGRAARTDWVWDGERGGESVGARLPGLAVAASRMEWHAEPEARLVYGEWTLEIANDHANVQEARAQIQLPPGGCVSRLTLWVNGEPQEAAFAGQSAVRAAYQKVVVVEQRDPVLVTQVGPDVVMMQCFPVPARGGRMKLRIGITAPLDSQGRLRLPQIIERNFSTPESLRHVIWMQSRLPFTAEPAGTVEKTNQGAQTWQQDMSNDALAGASFTWALPDPALLWCEDGLASPTEPRFVTGRWQSLPNAPPSAVAVVIDGSLALRPLRQTIAESIQAGRPGSTVAAWISTDLGPRQLDLSKPDADLADADFAGGRDSLESLRAALSWTRSQSGPAIVLWLHGPQPAEMGDPAALEQMLEFGLRQVPILDAPLIPGAHRLTEKLYRRSDLRSAGRLPNPQNDLPALVQNVLSGRQEPSLTTSRQSEQPARGTKTSDQLARYAAFSDTLTAFRSPTPPTTEIVASAARRQVVTPVTGAVVLESKRQYDESGLSQVDPSSVPRVPTIPEPGSALLILSGSALALLRRRR